MTTVADRLARDAYAVLPTQLGEKLAEVLKKRPDLLREFSAREFARLAGLIKSEHPELAADLRAYDRVDVRHRRPLADAISRYSQEATPQKHEELLQAFRAGRLHDVAYQLRIVDSTLITAFPFNL